MKSLIVKLTVLAACWVGVAVAASTDNVPTTNPPLRHLIPEKKQLDPAMGTVALGKGGTAGLQGSRVSTYWNACRRSRCR